jgi:hypothetical protein
MKPELLLAIQGVSTIMAMIVLICRAGLMTPSTPAAVRHQLAALFAALAVSLVLPPLAGKAALTLGVVAFLAMSAPRWRYGVPADLQRDSDA